MATEYLAKCQQAVRTGVGSNRSSKTDTGYRSNKIDAGYKIYPDCMSASAQVRPASL